MGKREQIAARNKRKEELREQIAISREAVAMSKALVKDSANLKKNVMRKVQQNPKPIMIGSAVLGLVFASLFRGKKQYLKLESGEVRKASKRRSWLSRIITGIVVKKVKNIALDKARGVLIHKIQGRQQY